MTHAAPLGESSIEPISRQPPLTPRPAVLRMRWARLGALHWRVPASQVQRMLPDGLTVDTHDGSAWVGLLPFEMRDVRPAGLPPVVPWIGDFPETNVRTYVTTATGERGVYFHSLEASRLGAVLVARGAFRLPYMWARMSVTTSPGRIRWTSTRRWPAPRGARTDVALRIGRLLPAEELTPLDDFLTARWRFLDAWGGRVAMAPMHHEAWPLHEATVEHLDDELLAAAGYGDLAGHAPDVVRFSPGVDVTGGMARRL
ncbi:MAG: hypothetical protein ACJA2H_000397 [Nitriliruptoraceae bacterium]|jgi:uncharacterized protein YqjF (DUF2071 family)